MANFFVQLGRAEHLGTGLRNIFKYSKLYVWNQPIIKDNDMYSVFIPLPLSQLEPLNEPLNDLLNGLSEPLNQIYEVIKKNEGVSAKLIAERTGVSYASVKRYIKHLAERNIVVRVGSKKTGGYEIVKK